MQDTIYALSTPAGRGGVAVIRVSGPAAWDGLAALTPHHPLPEPRKASTRTLVHPSTGDMLDHAMVIGFRAPASFTGEDCVEYHVHGGPAIVDGMLKALASRPYHRLAEPGEFTRRAFEHGKMDLTAAEAVADLIHAETESQRLQALKQMDGALFRLYEGWKERIARLLALMEADLDFSDQDLPDDLLLKVRPDVSDIMDEIWVHLHDGRRGELLRDGFRLVILGAPNAGKSSLLNRLVQRDAAIVSPIAGTTRDVIDVHLNLGGFPVILADTAGLRPDQLSDAQQGHDSIEMEGINRAMRRAEEADLKVLVFDGTCAPDPHTLALIDDKSVVVINKTDQIDQKDGMQDPDKIYMSAKTGDGIDRLVTCLIERMKSCVGGSDTPALTRARHRQALENTYACLERSMTAPLPELAAEDLRLSVRYLGSLTGRVDIEDLLDMIFRDFCIGK